MCDILKQTCRQPATNLIISWPYFVAFEPCKPIENTWNLPSWPVMRWAGLAGTYITNNSDNSDVPCVLALLLTLVLWRQRPPTLNSVPSGKPFCHLISHIDAKNWLIGKDPDAGKDWRQEEKGKTEDEMVGWHHRLDGHEFEQAPGVGNGWGSLVCWSPWGHKESDTTEWLNCIEITQEVCIRYCYLSASERSYSRGYGEGPVPDRPHSILLSYTDGSVEIASSILIPGPVMTESLL